MLDRLSREAVESGKEHPFVQALLTEFEDRLGNVLHALQNQAGVGDATHQRLCQLGGRAVELADIIRTINSVQGVDR